MIGPGRNETKRATLAGRLTPAGEGGISVVEVSGPSATTILDSLFISPRGIRASEMRAGQLAYGHLKHNGILLDEVLLELERPAPDPIYIVNCHGGAIALRNVMAGLVAQGAVKANWRQLLERRREMKLLDEVQLEAALAIPNALTLRAAQALTEQYRGALSGEAREIRNLIEDNHLEPARERLKILIANSAYGMSLLNPPRLVIIGKPNVGKSTLGNALLRHDRFIVHEQPGTTRDTVEEHFAVEGVPFLLVDTAGIRETRNEIESEGVRRTRAALAEAGIALMVFDASQQADDEEREILRELRGKNVLYVLNKSDLASQHSGKSAREVPEIPPAGVVEISALTGAGLPDLELRLLAKALPIIPPPQVPLCFTPRQHALLASALDSLSHNHTSDALSSLHNLTCPSAPIL